MDQENVYDVTIIGGGPTGLFSAFYGGLRQMKVKIIESMPQLGGQLAALYPEKYIYDIPGFPKVTGKELVDSLKEQTAQFNPTIVLEQSVLNIEKNEGVFTLTSNTGEKHYSKTILITAGVGAFEPRKLKLDNESKFEKDCLHYFVDDMNKFAGKKVTVFGGGDSALDWALMLEPIAEKVTLVHRRDKFRAHEHSVELLKKSSVEIMTPFVPDELIGEDSIEQVILKESKGDKKVSLNTDIVLVNYGFISSLGPIKDWGLELEKNSIVVDSRMETNIEGIYAAGDINTYEGKVKLIATGFGEAPTAISNAKASIDPKGRIQPLHSTSIMDKRLKEQEEKEKETVRG
ncbi:NAD(P)/FAD-dependent oxidoreductase [Virgibacillus alimentarius]|uniref:Ferredoxin--NADP reductase n=1 Tax=Virgibacillus alimentarius TaxID=698769 RepID=A0ABS4SAA0_9BACI|nr:NAD(P)/FAD-dependent oxidoreductase [Virgibacillus alimentarius]MBP2258339.1 thioredoxin reductase (NADPH) [Virgibacillus alimentarius]